MLTRLTIQNIVLIDKLIVVFDNGLNVLSGETGAGKSILLDALGLTLGARSDMGLVKEGRNQASVTAEFSGDLPIELQTLLEKSGLIAEDPFTLRRTVNKDGKSRAFVCDQPIGATLLKQIGQLLLEVHGQFETHGLLNPANHRNLLDAYANCADLKKKTKQTYRAWQTAVKEHNKACAEQDRAAAEEDFLKAAVAELNDMAPEEGEIEKLTIQRTQLQNREKIFDALKKAEQSISGHKGASDSLIKAGKVILRVVEKTEGLDDILDTIDRCASEIQDASHQLLRRMQDINADEATLDITEERLFKLRALARKHNIQPDDLHELQNDFTRRLELLMDQGNEINRLAKLVMQARTTFSELAKKLSAKRHKASEQLAIKIKEELTPLKLERAVFMAACTDLEEADWNADGMDRVTFLASTNPGQKPSPLNKVASGGELARFMLAIKVILAGADPVPTMVFDEVDAGIGGATASAVGARLQALGQSVQVMVVTHSPQIAARANHHLHVEKHVQAKTATTHISTLSKDQRIDEIARMLAGQETTDAAREAAQALMNGA